MKLKSLVAKMLRDKPEAANIEAGDVCAIIFIDNNDQVQVLKSNMTEQLFYDLCSHIGKQISKGNRS